MTTKPARCRICGKPLPPDVSKVPLFCSERCRLIDLAKWMGEEYRIPDRQEETEDAAPTIPDEEVDG
jgi:uncharacterized protein